MVIISQTGPMLIFTRIMFDFAADWKLNFMRFRCWTSIWIFVICLVIVCMGWSKYVSLLTRFTEESFATLIALIFIIEGVKKVFSINTQFISYDQHLATTCNSTHESYDLNKTVEFNNCMEPAERVCDENFPRALHNACIREIDYRVVFLRINYLNV